MINYLNYLGVLMNEAVVIDDFLRNTIDEGACAARSCVKNYSV